MQFQFPEIPDTNGMVDHEAAAEMLAYIQSTLDESAIVQRWQQHFDTVVLPVWWKEHHPQLNFDVKRAKREARAYESSLFTRDIQRAICLVRKATQQMQQHLAHLPVQEGELVWAPVITCGTMHLAQSVQDQLTQAGYSRARLQTKDVPGRVRRSPLWVVELPVSPQFEEYAPHLAPIGE